jgi:hypothetical protein
LTPVPALSFPSFLLFLLSPPFLLPANTPSDTPAVLLGTSELRDMSLAPSVVLEAHVTISHPQLRDLILPLRRGHVLYPYRSAIYEQRWNSGEDTPTPGGGVGIGGIGGEVKRTASSVQELFKLSFPPTCITTK